MSQTKMMRIVLLLHANQHLQGSMDRNLCETILGEKTQQRVPSAAKRLYKLPKTVDY